MSAAPGAKDASAPRLALLFAAISALIGSNLPYMPLWLDWVGLDARDIAMIGAAPLMARVAVAPAIALAADRSGNYRGYLVALSWAALAALLALAHARSYWPLFVLSSLFSLAWTAIVPLAETIAMRGVRAGMDYGRMRLWGSLSFIVAAVGGGALVSRLGAQWAILLPLAGAILVVAAAHLQAGSRGLFLPAAAGSVSRAALLRLLGSRVFLLLLVASGAVQAAHAVLYTFATLHWRAFGLSAAWAGVLWAVSIAAEVAVFASAGRILRRLRPAQLIVLGAAAAVVRWSAMGLDPPLLALLPLQALHGLTFGATHLGAMQVIARFVGEALTGTAQALHAASTSGVCMAAAMLSAGELYAAYAGRAYWGMAALAGVGLLAGLLLARCPRVASA
jgi:PPP family 3-phenylpropionic acid transporter